MNLERKRVPGWLIVLAMAAFIAAVGAAIYFNVRPDPTLPKTVLVPK